MEVAKKKPCNDQQKNKVVVKIGGGGGIGAVILFGGALATAALASAFVARKKGRSSGEERRRNHRDSAPEFSKHINGGDEVGNGGLQFVSNDASSDVHNKHPSMGICSDEATKEVKLENGTGLLVATRSQIMDEKPGTVVNCGTLVNGYDAETAEQMISSTSRRAVSGHGPVTIKEDSHPSDEKPAFELENAVHEEETKRNVTNESLKESNNAEQACVEEVKAGGGQRGDGAIEPMDHKEAVEITETKLVEGGGNIETCRDQEENEVIMGYNGVEGVDIDKVEAQKNVNVSANLEENDVEGYIRDNGETIDEKCDEGVGKTKGNVEVQQELNYGSEESSSLSETVVSESLTGAMPTEVVEMIQEDAALEGSKKDQMNIEEKEMEGRCGEHGDINEEKCDEEAIEKTEDDMAAVVLESHVEDDEQIAALQPVFQNPVVEHVVVSGEEKEGAVATEVAEMIQRDEAIEQGGKEEEDQMEHSSEGQMIKENKKENEEIAIEVTRDGGAVEEMARSLEASESKTSIPLLVCQPKDGEDEVEKNTADEVEEELIHHEDIEVKKQEGENEDPAKLEMNENKSFVCQPKDDVNVIEVGENKEVSEQVEINGNDAQGDVAKEVEQGLISPEKFEIKEENIGNEEISESLEASEEKTSLGLAVSQVENDGSPETIDTSIAAAKDNEIVEMSEDSIKGYSDETDSSEEIEESSTGESSVESNGEAVWPAESLDASTTRLLGQEVHGKTLEDKAAALKESDGKFAKGTGNSEKPILIRQGYVGTATTWRITIAMLSLVSSLSCSWLFGFSPVKMCLIVSLAMVLLKIQGY